MLFPVLSINIGVSKKVMLDGGRSMVSAIIKEPVDGSIYLDSQGFTGDESADRRFHGGADKSVCAYSGDHYHFWENFFLKSLPHGAFGENLTLRGLDENSSFLGDIYQFGATELQVSQPRVPCYKLNKKFERKDVVQEIRANGKSGFYFRVLKSGFVSTDNPLILLNRQDDPISISKANRLWQGEKTPPCFLESILAKHFVSSSWKKDLKKL